MSAALPAEHRDGVPPCLLRLIQGPVRCINKIGNCLDSGRGRRGQANADFDAQLLHLPFKRMAVDLLLELFRDLKGTLCAGLNEHDRQFVATVTSHDIRGPDIAFEKLGHCFDDMVPAKMTIGIIEVLEIIDID